MHTSMRASARQLTVPFHGAELYLVEQNGQPYAPMRPVVQGMGLDWKSQHRKLAEPRFSATVVDLTIVASDGKSRLMTCMALRKLPGWLMTIEPGKVRNPAVRERVIRYQNECDDVLWKYWTEGRHGWPARRKSGDAQSALEDRADALRYATELVIDRRVPFSAAYQVLNLFAGTVSFRSMTCSQAITAAQFGARLLSHRDTTVDWVKVESNRSGLSNAPVQLPLAGLIHPRLQSTDRGDI